MGINLSVNAQDVARRAELPYDQMELYVGSPSLVQGFIGLFVDIAKGLSGTQDSDRFGCYGIGYAHQFNSWFAVTGKFLYEGYFNNVYTDKTKETLDYRYLTNVFTIMPGARFTYLNRKYVCLYSSVDLGMTYMKDSNSKKDPFSQVIFALNVTAFGIQAGSNVYGLAELNAGSDAIVKLGIGVNF